MSTSERTRSGHDASHHTNFRSERLEEQARRAGVVGQRARRRSVRRRRRARGRAVLLESAQGQRGRKLDQTRHRDCRRNYRTVFDRRAAGLRFSSLILLPACMRVRRAALQRLGRFANRPQHEDRDGSKSDCRQALPSARLTERSHPPRSMIEPKRGILIQINVGACLGVPDPASPRAPPAIGGAARHRYPKSEASIAHRPTSRARKRSATR